MKLGMTRLAGGVWEAVLDIGGDERTPMVEVIHDGTALPDVTLRPLDGQPGHWAIRVPLPSSIIADGLQVLAVREAGTDEVLGKIAILAGEAEPDDLRSEVEMLRGELDLLKRAFRRQFGG